MMVPTDVDGYTSYDVCYYCKNKANVEVQHTITITQQLDCSTKAFTGTDGLSLVKDAYSTADAVSGRQAAITYSVTPEYKTLTPYTSASTLFNNVNSAVCGAFTSCVLGASGCSDPYTAGNIRVVKSFTDVISIEARQNVEAGYSDTVCVRCMNSAGGYTEHDEWRID